MTGPETPIGCGLIARGTGEDSWPAGANAVHGLLGGSRRSDSTPPPAASAERGLFS